MTASEELLDQLIDNQQQAMRYYLLFAGGLMALGMLVLGTTAVLSNQIIADAFKALFGLGGAFVSSLSAFQVKEVLSRRNTIQTLQKCKFMLRTQDQAPEAGDPDARKRIDEMVWRAVEKTIQGSG